MRGIPQKYIDILEQMIKSFIWDNKQPLVNKTTAYLPRDMGGLGVPNIQLICSSLNVKQHIE